MNNRRLVSKETIVSVYKKLRRGLARILNPWILMQDVDFGKYHLGKYVQWGGLFTNDNNPEDVLVHRLHALITRGTGYNQRVAVSVRLKAVYVRAMIRVNEETTRKSSGTVRMLLTRFYGALDPSTGISTGTFALFTSNNSNNIGDNLANNGMYDALSSNHYVLADKTIYVQPEGGDGTQPHVALWEETIYIPEELSVVTYNNATDAPDSHLIFVMYTDNGLQFSNQSWNSLSGSTLFGNIGGYVFFDDL